MLHFKTKFDSKDDRGKQELIIAEICCYVKLTKKIYRAMYLIEQNILIVINHILMNKTIMQNPEELRFFCNKPPWFN